MGSANESIYPQKLTGLKLTLELMLRWMENVREDVLHQDVSSISESICHSLSSPSRIRNSLAAYKAGTTIIYTYSAAAPLTS